MFELLLLLLIALAVLHNLIAYAFLSGKAEDILMWSFSRRLENIANKAGYERVQAQFALWIAIMAVIVVVHHLQAQKYYKE
jgi:hypothetical protein